MQDQSRQAAQTHGEDRVPFELAQGKKGGDKTAGADPVNGGQRPRPIAKYHHGQDGQPRPQDQRNDHRAQTGQDGLQQREVLVLAVDPRQQRHQNQGRGDAP